MNRLATETSPYLRQHANNPVDWYPWGDDAFERAKTEDLPVLLSVGYSSCHWCHVMAHESFEDDHVAAYVNARFVAIKVDREERPDVDAVYMEAVQAISNSGGWPMTVFLTPDGRPFFAGTYYPPVARGGMLSFGQLLTSVDDAWRNHRVDVETQADALADTIARRSHIPDELLPSPAESADPSGSETSRSLVHQAAEDLAARFDRVWGGFSPAPKFPQPGMIEICFQEHRNTGNPDLLHMATTTLGAMAAGGLHDHLGGGFSRYSTDPTWTVPHFEKMLYDQAGLLRAYLHAWQVTDDPRWAGVVESTVAYVHRQLTRPGGGVYSAEDADAAGVEGSSYVWTREQLAEVLGTDLAEVVGAYYGVTGAGNFDGANILRTPLDAPPRVPTEIERARQPLLEARSQRIQPGLDDKVLTEWNAMWCSALAEAAGAMDRDDWADEALSIAEFLLANLRRADGRWLRAWHGGEARHLAYAADHAWLVDAFTRLGELTGRALWLERATDVARALLDGFLDDRSGALWTTGQDAEELVVRPMDLFDGAVPSATSVAAAALMRLGALTGDAEMGRAGEDLLGSLLTSARRHPLAMANVVSASALADGGITELVITGSRSDLVSSARRRFEPTMVLAWGERTSSALWQDKEDGLAYVCRHYTCLAPASTDAELHARLDAERPPGRFGEARDVEVASETSEGARP